MNTDIGGDAHRRTCNFPTFPYGKRLSQEPHCKVLMFSLNCRCERNVVSLFVRRSLSSFWALLPLADLQDPLVRTCTLRKWNPRPACGTAIKSVRISMSVFGFAPTRDEPAESLPWTRRTGVRPCFLCSGNVRAHSGQQLANAVRPMIYVSFLEFQAGSCLYVTAAVKAASHFGKAQGDQSGQSQF